MWNRVGKDASGRGLKSGRRAKLGRRLAVEGLEIRQVMTASINAIANITALQYQGYQVPIQAGITHAQTYTVTSDNPGVKASIATGRFLTVTVAHTAASSSDVTVNGSMTFQLFDDFTPITTSMITSLVEGVAKNTNPQYYTANTDYYNGKVFHRILSGFPDANGYIIQGGSPTGHGTGNTFLSPFVDEFNQSVAFTNSGQLAMANSGPDTNDSQFFITTSTPTSLSYHHTIFGQLVAGQDIVTQLTKVQTENDPTTSTSTAPVPGYPVTPVTITNATVTNTNPNGVVHIDTTLAPVGAVANVTVTGTDVTDNTTATQTFQVNVAAQPSGTILRPFIGDYDGTVSVAEGQTAKFQINAISPTPGDSLTYTVQGGFNAATQAFVPIDTTKITASVDANGVVSVAPVAGAAGPTTLLIGVRDNTARGGLTDATVAGNYEFHTLTVQLPATTTPVPLRPLTTSGQTVINSVPGGTTPITLTGTNLNSSAALVYNVATPPTHGTITGYNATTNTLTYRPTAGYAGPDALTYTATDPTTGLSSFPTTIKLNVTNASTGAVRFIADDGSTSTTVPGVLIVTPNPRTDGGTNIINATEANGNVQITVNGVVDALMPTTANVDRLIIYGSKNSDRITVDPSLTTITTIDGGHGGTNVIQAGAGQTREHGWFGQNTLIQGTSENFQLGRTGHVKFVKGTGTSDVIFKGQPGYFPVHLNHFRHLPTPTTGTYYKFASNGKTLVETTNPYSTLNKQERAARTALKKLRVSAGVSSTGTAAGTPGARSNQDGSVSAGNSTGASSGNGVTAGVGNTTTNI